MENVNFKSGKIIFDEFHIDFFRPFSEQLDCLLEDLLQVKFLENCLLDVGWYPEYEEDGAFVIQVIKDQNWELPIYKKKCKEKNEFLQDIIKTIEIAENVF